MAVTFVTGGFGAGAFSGNLDIGWEALFSNELEAGDWVFAVVGTRDSVSCSMDGDDWTAVVGIADGDDTDHVSRWLWYHVYDGSTTPSTTVTHPSGSTIGSAKYAFRNVQQLRASSTANDGYDYGTNTLTMTLPTGTEVDDRVAAFIYIADTSITFNTPSGWCTTWNSRNSNPSYVTVECKDGIVTTASGDATATHAGVDEHHAYVVVALTEDTATVTGTGTVTSGAATLSSTGEVTAQAAATVASAPATMSATGTRGRHLGTATVATAPATVSATGLVEIGLPLDNPLGPPMRRVIRRLRQAPHLSDEHRRMRHVRFALDFERGKGQTLPPGDDPQVLLRWSDDGGQTWSGEHWVSAGKLGEYRRRAVWRRLGQARTRTYQVVCADPAKVAWLDAWIDVEQGHR